MVSNCIEKTHGSQAINLEVKLLRRTYVFPWSQFLFADGDADEIRIAFSTHDVVISGTMLDTLLADVAAQRVIALKEPVRAEYFASFSDPQITKIFIKKSE